MLRRIEEALGLTGDRIDVDEGWAFIPRTKNGLPRTAFLPPMVVDALRRHPRGLNRAGPVFRFGKNGRLYLLLRLAREAAGIDRSVTFHVFRHTWAAWMRRYAGLDTSGSGGHRGLAGPDERGAL